MNPVIEVKNVSKIYNPSTIPIRAVNNVNLTFQPGEFTVIVGASGSGKTSLLNLIGGIDSPNEGEVWVGGENISTMSESKLTLFRRNNIGFVFQQFNLLPVLSAQENVEFILEMQGKSKSERRNRAVELLTEVGLADKLDTRPAKLSGGQQQRVAVARALAHRPQFVLADEPTASLDSQATADLLSLMLAMNRKAGVTFIFSTHDQRVVEQARRVIEFEDGKVRSDTVV